MYDFEKCPSSSIFLNPFRQRKYSSALERIDFIKFISKLAETMGLDNINDLADYQSHKLIQSKYLR